MQATRDGWFKRADRFRRGDPRKHAEADEAARYRLEKLDLFGADPDPEHREMARACAPHRDAFASLPDGLCVYFEACGPRIGRRFAHLLPPEKQKKSNKGKSNSDDDRAQAETYPLRVFDMSRGGDWLDFSETVRLSAEHGLPVVHHERATLDLAAVCAALSAEPCPKYTGFSGGADLEGYVVRDTTAAGRIAKIRVDDMGKIAD